MVMMMGEMEIVCLFLAFGCFYRVVYLFVFNRE